MARYCGKEIRFNLMAVVQDPRIKLRRRIEALAEVPSASMEELAALKVRRRRDASGWKKRDAGDLSGSPSASGVAWCACATCRSVCGVQDSLAEEENKRRVWRTENIRRRHNYVPLIFNILVAMAEKGALQPLIKKCRGSGAF